jgi:Stage II sporulation protein E (SpoIIE)
MAKHPSLTQRPLPEAIRVATRVLPMSEDEPSGDAAACFDIPGAQSQAAPGHLLAIVDGLGHGAEAAQAAEAAMRVLGQQPDRPLPELLRVLDDKLLRSRGAAVGLMRVEADRAHYAGIGNTRAVRLRDGRMTRLSSQPGIVGGGLPQHILASALDLQADDWLLLFTDGLDEALQLPVCLPEWRRDPHTLCDHLLGRWRVGRDDAGVLVAHFGVI